MTELGGSRTEPRWGQQGREIKAEAVIATLRLYSGRELNRGAWLDIGCGSGGVAAALASHVEHIVGIDPEPWERWRAFGQQHSNLDFHTGSYRDLEAMLGAHSVDVVICNQVYEHVDDPSALLRAIHAVMKPGGFCYFAGPNLLWPIEPHVFWPFVHWLPRRFAIRLMSMFRARYAHCLDAWSWSYWRLTREFRETGFNYRSAIHARIRAQTAMNSSMLLRVLGRLPQAAMDALTPLAPGFIFVLTKAEKRDA